MDAPRLVPSEYPRKLAPHGQLESYDWKSIQYGAIKFEHRQHNARSPWEEVWTAMQICCDYVHKSEELFA